MATNPTDETIENYFRMIFQSLPKFIFAFSRVRKKNFLI